MSLGSGEANAHVATKSVRVVKDSWAESVREANDFIKWVIMECFLFIPVKYLLKEDDVPSTVSAFELQLPTLFLPTVFSYATCILGSQMFKSTKIKTTVQVLGLISGVAACFEAFFFVGYEAHISVTIIMVVILIAIAITKFCD